LFKCVTQPFIERRFWHYVRKPHSRRARTKNRDTQIACLCRRVSHYNLIGDARAGASCITNPKKIQNDVVTSTTVVLGRRGSWRYCMVATGSRSTANLRPCTRRRMTASEPPQEGRGGWLPHGGRSEVLAVEVVRGFVYHTASTAAVASTCTCVVR
jgi:hypothetical protein